MECRSVARLISDATERTVGKDDAVTGIDRAQDRREDLDIVLGARYIGFKSISAGAISSPPEIGAEFGRRTQGSGRWRQNPQIASLSIAPYQKERPPL
jgi:hypothetical protein